MSGQSTAKGVTWELRRRRVEGIDCTATDNSNSNKNHVDGTYAAVEDKIFSAILTRKIIATGVWRVLCTKRSGKRFE